MTDRIALIGSGLIGTGWAIVYAEAGYHPVLYDADPTQVEQALADARRGLDDLAAYGLLDGDPAEVHARIGTAETMDEAVAGAAHVQESVPERVEIKAQVFAALDPIVPREITIASSSSTIPTSRFTEDLPGRARCIIAHPGTPPHLLRLVEIVPAPWTDPAVVETTRALMEDIHQIPSVLKREIQGFILNRIQYAVIAECYRLWADGAADIEDIEKTVRDALGLRWSFMGPLETVSLNAPGGVVDYNERYGRWVHEINATQTVREWDPADVARLEAERLASRPAMDNAARREWRDRRLMALLAHKRERAGIEGE
jgi:L-gulonate 3-dehydrogenase